MFGMFSKDSKFKRTITKATNPRAQSPDRMAAMEKLADDGSDEALAALIKRFSFVYDKTIADQREKEWVISTLLSAGERCLPLLGQYMASASALGYPLTVMGRIVEGNPALEKRALDIVDDVLATEKPGYTRDPKRRIDVIEWLAEFDGASAEEVCTRVSPYLQDFDENVRFKCVEAIAVKPSETSAEPLLSALINEDEESKRLRVRIAEVLADNGWPIADKKDAVSALLSDCLNDFRLHRDKLVRKKKA